MTEVKCEIKRPHMSPTHSVKLWTCKICNKEFKVENVLKTHKIMVHDAESVTCKICGKIMKNVLTYKNHSIRMKSKQSTIVYIATKRSHSNTIEGIM